MIIINLQVNILQELLVPSKQLIEHVERDGLVPRQLDGLEEVVDDHLQVLAPGLRAQHRPVVYFFIIYYYFLLLLLLLLLFFFLSFAFRLFLFVFCFFHYLVFHYLDNYLVIFII